MNQHVAFPLSLGRFPGVYDFKYSEALYSSKCDKLDACRFVFFYSSQHCGWLFSLYLYSLSAAATTLSHRAHAFLWSLTPSKNTMGEECPAFTFSGFAIA